MKTVNVHAAKTQFSKLLAQVEATNQIVVICRNGKPVANLTPHVRKSRTKTDPVLSKIEIHFDPTETLSDDEWPKSKR